MNWSPVNDRMVWEKFSSIHTADDNSDVRADRARKNREKGGVL